MTVAQPLNAVVANSAPPTLPTGRLGQPIVPRVLVAGCHGGAGTTTLARLLGRTFSTFDVQFAGLTYPPNPNGAPLVLVTRNHVDGSRQATEMVNRLQRFQVIPLVVVVVADGPWPDPPITKVRLRMLEPLVPRIVRIPFVTQWRYHDTDVAPAGIPKKLLRPLADVANTVIAAITRRRPW